MSISRSLLLFFLAIIASTAHELDDVDFNEDFEQDVMDPVHRDLENPPSVQACLQQCTVDKKVQNALCKTLDTKQKRLNCNLSAHIEHFNCFDKCRNINACTPECTKLKGMCILTCERNNELTVDRLRCIKQCHNKRKKIVDRCFRNCIDTPAPTPAPTTPPTKLEIYTIPDGSFWFYEPWGGEIIAKYDDERRLWMGKAYPAGLYGPDMLYAGLESYYTLDARQTNELLAGCEAQVIWEPATLTPGTVMFLDSNTIMTFLGTNITRVNPPCGCTSCGC